MAFWQSCLHLFWHASGVYYCMCSLHCRPWLAATAIPCTYTPWHVSDATMVYRTASGHAWYRWLIAVWNTHEPLQAWRAPWSVAWQEYLVYGNYFHWSDFCIKHVLSISSLPTSPDSWSAVKVPILVEFVRLSLVKAQEAGEAFSTTSSPLLSLAFLVRP